MAGTKIAALETHRAPSQVRVSEGAWIGVSGWGLYSGACGWHVEVAFGDEGGPGKAWDPTSARAILGRYKLKASRSAADWRGPHQERKKINLGGNKTQKLNKFK